MRRRGFQYDLFSNAKLFQHGKQSVDAGGRREEKQLNSRARHALQALRF
jgi:hypothetical protein